MKNFEKLNKNEMKMIVGGVEELEDGAGDKYQCCPDLGTINCSACVSGTPETLSCTFGKLTKC